MTRRSRGGGRDRYDDDHRSSRDYEDSRRSGEKRYRDEDYSKDRRSGRSSRYDDDHYRSSRYEDDVAQDRYARDKGRDRGNSRYDRGKESDPRVRHRSPGTDASSTPVHKESTSTTPLNESAHDGKLKTNAATARDGLTSGPARKSRFDSPIPGPPQAVSSAASTTTASVPLTAEEEKQKAKREKLEAWKRAQAAKKAAAAIGKSISGGTPSGGISIGTGSIGESSLFVVMIPMCWFIFCVDVGAYRSTGQASIVPCIILVLSFPIRLTHQVCCSPQQTHWITVDGRF